MVSESGQLYTMEGIAAGILMLTTAYLVLSTTSVYTPAETHISDMQLQQLGDDALQVLDIPLVRLNESELERTVREYDTANFTSRFGGLVTMNGTSNVNFIARIYSIDGSSGTVRHEPVLFAQSTPIITGRERMVKVSRLVVLRKDATYAINTTAYAGLLDDRYQSVLLEVSLWRA